MSVRSTRQYLETQIVTASKEQLLLMLFDGAIRFCEQAKSRIEEKDIEGSYNLLIKAQNIVIELMSSLDKKIGDELYGNLMSLYNFVYMRLVDANIKKERSFVDDALKILYDLRGTWSEAIDRSKAEAGGQAGATPARPKGLKPVKLPVIPPANDPARRSINIQG